jgi:Met-zincin
VKWLIDNTLNQQSWLTPKQITGKITNDGGMSTHVMFAARSLGSLLRDDRLNRMIVNEMRTGAGAYKVSDMFSDLRSEVWKELARPSVAVTPFRRQVQRTFVNTLLLKLGGGMSDTRSMARAELETARTALTSASITSTDAMTASHYRDLLRQIEFGIANPDKVAPPAAAAPAGFPRLRCGCDPGSEHE